jgi:type II secretory pathway predicted ATPase ExeA
MNFSIKKVETQFKVVSQCWPEKAYIMKEDINKGNLAVIRTVYLPNTSLDHHRLIDRWVI